MSKPPAGIPPGVFLSVRITIFALPLQSCNPAPLVGRDQAVEEIRAGLRKKLPSSAYRALQTASKRFYRVMFGKRATPRETLAGRG